MKKDYMTNRNYGMRIGIQVSTPIVMWVFLFDANTYDADEVNDFSKETCMALNKHDENVVMHNYRNVSYKNVVDSVNVSPFEPIVKVFVNE